MPAGINILAIDCATQTGLAQGEIGASPVFETVRFGDSGDSDFETGAACLRWIAFRLTDNPPQQIWIEEPIPFEAVEGRSSKASLIRLNGLYMIIGSAARLRGIKVNPIRITSARVGFLGNGRLKREIAKKRSRRMCRLLGWEPMTDDEGDAGCIWWNACLANDKTRTPPISKMMHKQAVDPIPPKHPLPRVLA